MFAALNAASGKVSGECYPRHRHQEFIKFLRRLDSEYEPDLELHLIMDNYGTHKHEKVRRFLDRHRRFKVHYIPTSSSFAKIERCRQRLEEISPGCTKPKRRLKKAA